MKPRPQNWSRLAAQFRGRECFYFWAIRAFQTATLKRLGPIGKHSTRKDQLLRTTTSAGSFLVEVINMEKNVHRGGPCTRSQNCIDFSTPHLESRKLATFASMCARCCKASEALPASVRSFRGLPRPHSWGFEAFRGLARPRQNPKTSLACKITRPRGPGLIIQLSPDEPWLPLCKKTFRPRLAPSPLHSLFKTSRRTWKGPRPLKMILQAILAAASFNVRLLDGPQKRLRGPELSKTSTGMR